MFFFLDDPMPEVVPPSMDPLPELLLPVVNFFQLSAFKNMLCFFKLLELAELGMPVCCWDPGGGACTPPTPPSPPAVLP